MDYGAVYTKMHEDSPKLFAGNSIKPYVGQIAELVAKTKATRLLDYGSGKGYQYLKLRVHEAWGILPHCYDVGVRQLSEKPEGFFDGVICTDVMEHIEEQDVDAVLADIFASISVRPGAKKSFAFFVICCRPAKKKVLPDGRNVHLTVKPPAFWQAKLDKFARSGLIIEAVFDEGEA